MDGDIDRIIQESKQILKELGWSVAQSREHLEDLFNKRSRLLLTDEEWPEYLNRLREEKACHEIFKQNKNRTLTQQLLREVERTGTKQKIGTFLAIQYGRLSYISLTSGQLKETIEFLKILQGSPEENCRALRTYARKPLPQLTKTRS